MLVDFLLAHEADLIQKVESRAAADEGPGPASGRRARVTALVEELIETLQRDGGPPPGRSDTGIDAAVQSHERSLIRQETVSEVVTRSLPVPPGEIVTLSDWATASNEHLLEERMRRLSDLLDDVHDDAGIITRDGRVEYLNRRAASFVHQTTGVPMDQLVGKTGRELGIPAEIDFDTHPEAFKALARQRASREALLLGRWYKSRYRAISSGGGDLEAIAFVHSDIHERKLAEQRVEVLGRLTALLGTMSYEDASDALASVPIPEFADWCTVNVVEQGRIVRTSVSQSDPAKTALRNAVMHHVLEWNENPLWTQLKLTKGFQLLTDVSDALLRKLAVDAEQYAILKQLGVQSMMVQPVVLRGETVAIFNLMYTTESGRRYGRGDPELAAEMALHTAHIIENARLLRDLRASEARFRIAIAGAKTVVFEQDSSLRYTWCFNPLAPFLTLLGRTDEETFSADDAAVLTALKRRVLESGARSSQELELTIRGERRTYRESTEAVRDAAGKPVGIIGSATDITDERRTRQQLADALCFRDRMMGVLGHDLRTPLSAAKLAAATLRRENLTEGAQERVAIIERATNRMSEMIATLLDFARTRDHGELPVTRVPTNIAAVARDVASELATSAPGRALQVDVQGEVEGSWDPARIGQAIMNLVANALQHGDPRGPVRLSVDGSGDAVVVTVKNDGPPITPELRPVLFEAFSRGDRTRPGLGLGLFIVKEIVAAHGGTIEVESSAESGTVFKLVLPRAGRRE
jgi:signal transduction histidine kinase